MNNYIITVFRDVHTMDYYHKICIYDMALLYSRLNTGSEQPVKSLKSPQCGDFLQTLVKKDWRSFACCETEKEKIVLGTSGFAKCVGSDAIERKEYFYETRISETTIYRVAV